MAEHQGPRRHAYVKILVEGRDLTSRFAPYLISVQVITVFGEQARCNIELDDRNAELIIPGDSARIQVVMGWHHEGPRIINVGSTLGALKPSSFELDQEAKWGGPGAEEVFDGSLSNCESGFGRNGGGRRIWLECEGGKPQGTAKEGQTDTIGEGKKRDSEAATDEGGAGLGAADAAAANAAVAAGGLASKAGALVGGVIGGVVGTIVGGPVGGLAGSKAGTSAGAMLGGAGAGSSAGNAPTTSVVSTLTAEGFVTDSIGDPNAPPDAPGTFSEGKISLMEAGTQFFGKAGMTLKLSPEMMKIRRNFWQIQNESVQAWAERIAKDVGGVLNIKGNVAVIVGKNEGLTADGEEVEVIEAVWGINLIGWRIKPFIARPQYGSAASRFFNLDKGVWEQTKESIEGQFPYGQALATAFSMASEVDKNTGDQKNKGAADTTKWEKGTGWCLFNGDPRAKAGAKITIIRARPGIDGTYTMDEVEHNYQRGVGYTTRANVRAPNPTGKGGGFGNDPGRIEPPSLSNPAVPAPDPSKQEPGESAWDYFRRLMIGDEEKRIEARVKAGFITREEADRRLAQIKRQRFTVEEQERIKRYNEERRQGFAQ